MNAGDISAPIFSHRSNDMTMTELEQRCCEAYDRAIAENDGDTPFSVAIVRAVLAEAGVAELVEALRVSAVQFRFYETQHLAKGTADGDEKACRNHDMAAMCEAALAKIGATQ